MIELFALTISIAAIAIIALAILFTAFTIGFASGFAYRHWSYGNGDRHWPTFQRLIVATLGRVFRHFYKFKVQGSLPSGPVVYAHHPHGMLSMSAALLYLTEVPNVRLAVHQFFFIVPGLRDLCQWMGLTNIGPETGLFLSRGTSVAIVPGGVREHDNAEQRPDGFLQWSYRAWQYPVVPVWCPTELQVAHVWKPGCLGWLRSWAMSKKWLRWPLGTFCWPRRQPPPLIVKIGPPLNPKDFDSVQAFTRAYWAALDVLKND